MQTEELLINKYWKELFFFKLVDTKEWKAENQGSLEALLYLHWEKPFKMQILPVFYGFIAHKSKHVYMK